MNKLQVKLIAGSVGAVLLLLAAVLMFDVFPIAGNEVGVKETYLGGVHPQPFPARTYFILPWERMYKYSTALQVYEMSHAPAGGETTEGWDSEPYKIQSKDAQTMDLSLQVQWRIDAEKVVDLHRQIGPNSIEAKVLRPIVLRIVKDEATTRDALIAYSGPGLVELQSVIERDLADPQGELRLRGIIVDSFVLQKIELDPAYVTEINARQVAIQKEMRAVQEEKAAQAEALKAKAVARADYEKTVVEAERDKAKLVLAAEADNEKAILAAEAEKRKAVLVAEGERDAGELRAAGILAIGKATAEAKRLEFTAYGEDGADNYVKLQVANSMGQAFSGIKGYLPSDMTIVTLGQTFLDAVQKVTAGSQPAQ